MNDPIDPELTRLLILELTRHLPSLESTPLELDTCRRTLHALKGSAGLAGQSELAAALQRLERRVRDGEPGAISEAAEVVRTSMDRLSRGQSATGSVWPNAPPDLLVSTLDPLVRTQYVAELADRLSGIDEALASAGDPVEAALVVYRHLHTMKGAASAVGDEPMSWFAHGLEECLKGANHRDAAIAALGELAHWRAVLGGLLDDPEAALRTLRDATGKRDSAIPLAPGAHRRNRSSSGVPSTPLVLGPLDSRPATEEATIRVHTASVDRLLDRFVAIGLARERIAARTERTREHSRKARHLRAELSEGLRLIGPPRPWGPPAAALSRIDHAVSVLTLLGDDLESDVSDMRGSDLALKDSVSEAKRQLSGMRQTPLRQMFTRLASAVEAEARRMEREVTVRMLGAEETIDRRLAELLVEPCLQIARNSVAHGIESPEMRTAAGKPAVGTVTLAARRSGHRLLITIEDDGAGVDVGAVRRRAIDAGAVTASIAEAADDDTLLALLFFPGFSTRDTSDLLAGRGIGLDIALSAIQRLGGALRLSSRYGEGFSARVEIPIESGLASVLWVTAGQVEYAVPAANAVAVRRNESGDAARLPHMAACLEARANDQAFLSLELDLDGDDPPIMVGIDAVGRTEEVLIRPLTALVATMGPYAGAVVREDGSLRLAIDIYALAPRARALGRRASL